MSLNRFSNGDPTYRTRGACETNGIRIAFQISRSSNPCRRYWRTRKGGFIVHVSSDAGVWGEEEIGAYSVSKAALKGSGARCLSSGC